MWEQLQLKEVINGEDTLMTYNHNFYYLKRLKTLFNHIHNTIVLIMNYINAQNGYILILYLDRCTGQKSRVCEKRYTC